MSEPRERVIVVGCGKTKRAEPSPAGELYTGNLFLARRRYAQASGCRWVVYSALFGLLPPEQIVAPYDWKMSQHSKGFRAGLGSRFMDRLRELVGSWAIDLEIHAGADYADTLEAFHLVERGVRFLRPLAGLGVGEQLRWYAERRSNPGAAAAAELRELPLAA